MMQYLITTFTDSTGLPHNHVTKAKDNQTFTVVEAESKEEVESMLKQSSVIDSQLQRNIDWLNMRSLERKTWSNKKLRDWKRGKFIQ
ncbi:DUF1381 domain-containing protein [Staphylococcus warneri]|nr:DUF1381 domain-containing protein [Staphylococcus warneri]